MKLIAATVFAFGLATGVFAQTTGGQDMKNAGTETKDAAKDVGKGIKKGTTKSVKAVKHTTHKAAKKVEQKTQ